MKILNSILLLILIGKRYGLKIYVSPKQGLEYQYRYSKFTEISIKILNSILLLILIGKSHGV